MLIGNIFHDRQGGVFGPETTAYRWVRIGSLYIAPDEIALRLRGFAFGPFSCKPLPEITHPPFIQGTITHLYYDLSGKTRWQWIGRIYTAQHETSETVYYGSLAVWPCCAVTDDALALTVKLDELDTSILKVEKEKE